MRREGLPGKAIGIKELASSNVKAKIKAKMKMKLKFNGESVESLYPRGGATAAEIKLGDVPPSGLALLQFPWKYHANRNRGRPEQASGDTRDWEARQKSEKCSLIYPCLVKARRGRVSPYKGSQSLTKEIITP